jgi:DNA-binding response OmpR family regulator
MSSKPFPSDWHADETCYLDQGRILVVAEDVQARALLCELLSAHGYSVTTAEISGAYRASECDIVILDTSVGWRSGRSFRKPRAASTAWIIVIAGERRPEGVGRHYELERTADSILTKPFNPLELLLMLRGIFRDRARWLLPKTLRVGPLHLQRSSNLLMNAGQRVLLTDVESRILAELMSSPGIVVRREWLASFVAGRSLDMHINRLRRKVGTDVRGRTPIRSAYGIGYMLVSSWEPAMQTRARNGKA